MSIVIAKKIDKGFIVASDSQITSDGQRRHIEPGCKLFHPNDQQDIIVGIVGSLRDANLLRVIDELLDYSSIHRDNLTLNSIINHTVKVIQEKLREQGRIVVSEGKWLWDSAIIVANKDKAFEISQDFCVQEIKDFTAIGAPEEYVYGAKAFMDSYGLKKAYSEEQFVVDLIKMTIKLTNTVDYPIVLMNTVDNSTKIIERTEV